ncbi:MAG TPA: hypothetical protein VER39_07875 [Nocardioidaceae bacterium]|nr:hypothetical protein [Nocardioidaceae bacterium]
MDPTTLGPLWGLVVGIAGGTALVLAVTSVVLLAGRRRLERELWASRTELASLRERVDALTQTLERSARSGAPQEYLITSLPPHVDPAASAATAAVAPAPQDSAVGAPLSGRAFATVALTDSVVKAASLGYGVRRALSPQNRNRIRFEMGREVKRSRRQRRRDLKEARRHLRRSSDLDTSHGTGSGVGSAA